MLLTVTHKLKCCQKIFQALAKNKRYPHLSIKWEPTLPYAIIYYPLMDKNIYCFLSLHFSDTNLELESFS